MTSNSVQTSSNRKSNKLCSTDKSLEGEDCTEKMARLSCGRNMECMRNRSYIDKEDSINIEGGELGQSKNLQNVTDAVKRFYKAIDNFNKKCEKFSSDSEMKRLFNELILSSNLIKYLVQDDKYLLREIFNKGIIYRMCLPDSEYALMKIGNFKVKSPALVRTMAYFKVLMPVDEFSEKKIFGNDEISLKPLIESELTSKNTFDWDSIDKLYLERNLEDDMNLQEDSDLSEASIIKHGSYRSLCGETKGLNRTNLEIRKASDTSLLTEFISRKCEDEIIVNSREQIIIPIEANISVITILFLCTLILNFFLYHSRYRSTRFKLLLSLVIISLIVMGIWVCFVNYL